MDENDLIAQAIQQASGNNRLIIKNGKLVYPIPLDNGTINLGLNKLGLGAGYTDGKNTLLGGYAPGQVRLQYNRKF